MGLNILAHFCCPSGLQQAALGLVRALECTGVRTSCRDVTVPGASIDSNPDDFRGDEIYEQTLIHVQPDPYFNDVESLSNLRLNQDNYRIAYWYWESDRVPGHWSHVIGRHQIQEVWAASHFAVESMRRSLPVPVYHLPPAVFLGPVPSMRRSAFGLPDDRFTFLFMFDMRSVMERKNPIGLINAFRSAFRPNEPVQLVIRAHHGQEDNLQWRRLITEVRRTANVFAIDRALSRTESYGLLGASDCYVSLHRAEGFGLTMAEAMLAGKPVIATGYSGNMDFMTAENSYLVSYDLASLCDMPPYPPDTRWAVASIEHAAALMRSVYEDPEGARRRAVQGQRDALANLSPGTAGARIAERLSWITGGRYAGMGI